MIEIKKLCFGYVKRESLFSDLNLNLAKGGVCGLLGKNGAGKTTLLKLIAGLLFPKKGTSQIMGYTPKHRLPSFLESIYFIPEDFFVPELTATDYIKFYAPFYKQFDSNLFQNSLCEFALPKDKPLTSLSYGQRKKFLLSFGLATQCKLLMLDEPTNGLDIPSKAQFRKLLASTITDERLFIISTHQVHDVENLIDSIVLLDEGQIVFNSNMSEVAKQLSFEKQKLEPEIGSCLYYEKDLSGYTVVKENKTENDTNVDLELLFNTILANKDNLQKLFLRG